MLKKIELLINGTVGNAFCFDVIHLKDEAFFLPSVDIRNAVNKLEAFLKAKLTGENKSMISAPEIILVKLQSIIHPTQVMIIIFPPLVKIPV
jgi:hypothetical protein